MLLRLFCFCFYSAEMNIFMCAFLNPCKSISKNSKKRISWVSTFKILINITKLLFKKDCANLCFSHYRYSHEYIFTNTGYYTLILCQSDVRKMATYFNSCFKSYNCNLTFFYRYWSFFYELLVHILCIGVLICLYVNWFIRLFAF